MNNPELLREKYVYTFKKLEIIRNIMIEVKINNNKKTETTNPENLTRSFIKRNYE